MRLARFLASLELCKVQQLRVAKCSRMQQFEPADLRVGDAVRLGLSMRNQRQPARVKEGEGARDRIAIPRRISRTRAPSPTFDDRQQLRVL